MIIVTIILAFFIGNLCTNEVDFLESMSNLTLFYVSCLGVLLVSKIYFFKKPRLNIETISNCTNQFKIISIVASFGLTILGFLNLIGMFSDNSSIFTLISSVSSLISGLSLLGIIVLTIPNKIRNQFASSVGSVPIFWLVYELALIFKENISNPRSEEYIFAIIIYVTTSLAVYQFSSAFCINDKTNFFREYYNLSIFVNVVYALATFNGLVSTESIILINTIGGCSIINLFMFAYYLNPKTTKLEKLQQKFAKKEPEDKPEDKPSEVK